MSLAGPSPLCDRGCSHKDIHTCKGLQQVAFASTGLQNMGSLTVTSAMRVQKRWVEDLYAVRKEKGLGGDGTGRVPRGIGSDRVNSLRRTIAGNITHSCLSSVRDMFQRRRTHPFYVDCNAGHFQAVFHKAHGDPGLQVRTTPRGVLVTIFCMKTFLFVLDLHPTDVEVWENVNKPADRRQGRTVFVVNPEHPARVRFYIKETCEFLGLEGVDDFNTRACTCGEHYPRPETGPYFHSLTISNSSDLDSL